MVPTRRGNHSLTITGISTLLTAMPASASTLAARKVTVSPASARSPSPRVIATRPASMPLHIIVRSGLPHLSHT